MWRFWYDVVDKLEGNKYWIFDVGFVKEYELCEIHCHRDTSKTENLIKIYSQVYSA